MGNQKIGVFGLWHLGCILSACWAKLGHQVVGYDPEVKRASDLQQGIPPLFEPHLPETILENIKAGRLNFSSKLESLSDCDFIFLSYDTPVNDKDESDTTILTNSVEAVKNIMKPGAILVVSSQSPVGFCAQLIQILKAKNQTFDLAYSPENLRLGEAIDCYLNPGRIILGTSNKSTEERCAALFAEIPGEVLKMSLESAEVVKHGINAFLAASVVFANNLADICEATGARIDDVVKGMKSDVRIGLKAYLSPGIGFSGGTLGRDLKVLDGINKNIGGYAHHFGDIHGMNFERKQLIVQKIKQMLGGTLQQKTVAIMGLTYKPETSTLRRSLPLEIVDLLLAEQAKVQVFDPKADYKELDSTPKFIIKDSISEAATKADIIVLLTDWKQFKEFAWDTVVKNTSNPIFYDTKNCLDEHKMRAAGYKYYAIGK